MKHYTSSDYALNRYSEGIVYRFADSIVEVTLADYLADNPDKTAADFQVLKEFSDSNYYKQDRAENAQTKKNTSIDGVDEALLCLEPSPEDVLFGAMDAIEAAEWRKGRLIAANHALDKLTEKQRKRYLMYHIEGKTVREIADIEDSFFTSVYESLQGAEKKIKKVLSSA